MDNKNDLVNELLEIIQSNKSDEEIRQALSHYHESDIADAVPLLSDEDRNKLFSILKIEDLSELFTYLDDVEDYLEEMDEEKVADIIENMDADDAADILEELDEEKAESIIEKVEDEELVEDLNLIQSYDEDEIGSKMTTNYVTLEKDYSIKKAMRELIEQAKENDNITKLYVLDENDKFYGTIELTDLIIAREKDELSKIIKTSYPTIRDKEKISDVLPMIKDMDLDLIPVLDDEDHLVGVITSSDIIEVVDEELGEDYAMLAGLTEEEDLDEPLYKSLRKRIPWLGLLLVLGLIISLVISGFEPLFSALPVVVFFQSMVLDMSGNVGTQSLAVTIRGISDNAESKKIRKQIFKEIRVGFLNGIIMGILAFMVVFSFLFIKKQAVVLSEPFNMRYVLMQSGIVAVSLVCAMTVSAATGSIVPVLFKKIHIDPAVASGPLITTISDICGVIVYYGFATILFRAFL